MNYRKKILLSAIFLFLIYMALIFPFATSVVRRIIKHSLFDRTKVLIQKIIVANDSQEMVQIMQTRLAFSFQRVTLFDVQQGIVYEAHPLPGEDERRIGDASYLKQHPEITDALQKGTGYSIFILQDLPGGVVYAAVLFEFQGEKYILRTGYPYHEIQKLEIHFQLHFIVLGILFLLFYALTIWVIINRISKPIQEIIQAILPYQEGKVEILPRITLENIDPSDEFNHLANTLNALSKKIENQMDALKNFITNAAHELRTPLTVIQGFAETLQEEQLAPEMVGEVTEKIVKTCKRLNQLVKSLLTLASLEKLTEDRLHPTDLISLAEKCKDLLLQSYPNCHVTLKTDLDEAIVNVDTDLLELAIINLLENAAKYSKNIPQIEITLERHGDRIALMISDQGIGIPEADLPLIFDRFFTVDKSRTRKTGGAGLGLSIVKTIIEKHHGHLTATSELGKGSRFTIFLSLSPQRRVEES